MCNTVKIIQILVKKEIIMKFVHFKIIHTLDFLKILSHNSFSGYFTQDSDVGALCRLKKKTLLHN